MKTKYIILLLFLMTISYSHAQKENDKPSKKVVTPILLNKTLLSGIGLDSIYLKDQPKRSFFQKQVYRGTDISVYMISSGTASKYFESFPIEEFIYMMNGKAVLEPKDQESYEFSKGDFVAIPKGYKGNWTTVGGNKYHLELSVISNKRADAKAFSKIKNPFAFDRNLLSGTNMTSSKKDHYLDILYSGIELQITLNAEKPSRKTIVNSQREELIHILNGMVEITPINGAKETFYAGDFFVLPKGFHGDWVSKGHNLFRLMRISAVI